MDTPLQISNPSDTDRDAGWRLSLSYAHLPSELFARVQPTPVRQPSLVILNSQVAGLLGLDAQSLQRGDQVGILAGNGLPSGSDPIAQAYAGHQFGGFSMLGDGRAILLGEQTTPDGQLYDVQLKGSGPTPYSRRGDGRASLGPMLREYIISHAMQALGIPTTLSLAVTRTGEPVYRYGVEPGAVLTRVASSHLRVGTFQYAAAQRSAQRSAPAQFGPAASPEAPKPSVANESAQRDLLQELADYSIQRHYPELIGSQQVYLRFLQEVIQRQAALVAQWMSVGFIHGVMNTDNVSIAGETIDYGPCAFMNRYDPATVFSSIDEQGRYAFGNQPAICQWNLARFAESLLPLLSQEMEQAIELATQAIHSFPGLFAEQWLATMRRKLGLLHATDGDRSLVEDLLSWMAEKQLDFTNTFRDLTLGRFTRAIYEDAGFQDWQTRWMTQLESTKVPWSQAQELMRQCNPVVIPRNHRVEEALAAAVQANDLQPLHRLLKVLSHPFEEMEGEEQYREPPEGGDAGYCTFCGT
jgi:uncharacterized protein YdiU (UPF0061 family)